ncbi:hypothetical protein [uncultured Marinococcus sp.]|nr:hypothetical protein [uncultured Marinococcus sp.]
MVSSEHAGKPNRGQEVPHRYTDKYTDKRRTVHAKVVQDERKADG